jgi:hypothetical protein
VYPKPSTVCIDVVVSILISRKLFVVVPNDTVPCFSKSKFPPAEVIQDSTSGPDAGGGGCGSLPPFLLLQTQFTPITQQSNTYIKYFLGIRFILFLILFY